jgi:hypothetical protein
MRLYCLVPVFVVFMSNVLIAQDSTFKTMKYLQLAEAIDHDKTKKRIHLENEDFLAHASDGAGTLDGYFSKGKLRKIHCFIGNSLGTDVKDFYFSEGRLVYVRHTSRQLMLMEMQTISY